MHDIATRIQKECAGVLPNGIALNVNSAQGETPLKFALLRLDDFQATAAEGGSTFKIEEAA